MRRLSLAHFASLLALASACGGGTTEGCLDGPCTGGVAGSGGTTGAGAAAACDMTPKTGEYPCDVFTVIHDNCHSCHQDPPINGAPFSLLTYADTQELFNPSKRVFQQMYDQIQPGAAPRMPLNGTLTDAEQKTLDDWLLACAPPAAAGSGCGCPGNGCN